jgi:hypothetical protein
MSASGDSVISWHQLDNHPQQAAYQVFKSEYSGGAWLHPTDRGDNISPNGFAAVDPAIAMDDLGQSIIVWRGFDGIVTRIFKSERRAGAWVHPTGMADNISPTGGNSRDPRVAMQNHHEALIAWNQRGQIFKSEYRGGAWTHPANLSDNINPTGTPAHSATVAIDELTNSMVVWLQTDNAGKQQIFKSEYR